LGKSYEITHLNHSFKHGMQQISAECSMRDNDGSKVIICSVKAAQKEWGAAHTPTCMASSCQLS